MMLEYLKVNGVDKKGGILGFSVPKDLTTGTMEVHANTTMGTALGWFEGQSITAKTTDDKILFNGVISSINRQISNNATYNWTIQCKDIRLYYQNISVNIAFKSSTTVIEAISTLIQNYTTDTIDVNEISTTALCPLSFSGDKLPDAIQACLSLLDVPCHWSIEYDENTGALTHNFKKTYYINVGTLDYCDVETGDFIVKTDEIFNHLEIFSSSVIWPLPDIQYYDYIQNLEAHESIANRVKLPLKRAAKGLTAFLLVGNQSSDLTDFMRASRIPWTNIKGIDDADGGLIGFDVNVAGSLVIPSYSIGSSGQIVSTIYGAQESIAFSGEVISKISDYLKPDSTIYLQSAAKDDAPYGYLYIPTLSWLKSKASIVASYAGTVIEPENILGWAIVNTIEQPMTIPFDDKASQAIYGVKPAPKEELKTGSLTLINLYGTNKLKYLSEARESGQATVQLWKGNTQVNNFYPEPGDLVDLKHHIRGDKSDLCVQRVTYDYEYATDRLFCTIDTGKRSKYSAAELLARKIKAALDYVTKPTDEETSEVIEISASATVTCDVEVTDNTSIGFGSILRGIYYG